MKQTTSLLFSVILLLAFTMQLQIASSAQENAALADTVRYSQLNAPQNALQANSDQETPTETDFFKKLIRINKNTANQGIENEPSDIFNLNAASQVVYLRSTVGAPWGWGSETLTNEQEMNAVFGAGNWQDLRYETAVVATVFSASTKFVFMEGSDGNADEMEAFLTANKTVIENWVRNGGRLLLNSAPNEGNGMNFGFDNTQLVYLNSSETARAAAGQSSHPIFTGPFLPTGTGTFTGNWFSHASVTCGNCTTLITGDNNKVILAKKSFGSGYVMFGGMTLTYFHDPKPNASNLRKNILSYLFNLPPANTAPVANNQSVNANEDTSKSITLTATDAENNSLTYTVTAAPTNGTLSGTAPNLTYTPNANYNGADSFKFKVNDGSLDSTEATVSINIAAVNDAPQMSGLPSSPTIDELAAYTFTASASDVDSPANSLVFSLQNAPAGASITLAGAFSWTPSETQGAGAYNFSVRLSDGADYSEQSITINVAEVNAAPVLAAIGDKSRTWGGALSFSAAATDSDLPANNLTYSLAAGTIAGNGISLNVPQGASINPTSGAFSWNIAAAQVGVHRFKIVVTDNGTPALSDSEEITVTVNKANQTINWSNPSAITYGTALSATQLNATAAGIDNQTPLGGLTYNPAAGTVLSAGNHQLTVTAAETAHYNAASANVSLTVNKAALTVKADDKSKTYGGAAVPFTVSYNGFVNGETANNLGGTLAFNFADSTATPAGQHTITPGGLTSANYAVAFQNGTLTVNKALLNLTADDKSKTYGAANPTFTAALVGVQNNDVFNVNFATPAVALSNVGVYDITPSLADPGNKLSNYVLAVTEGKLTINKADQTINWSNPAAITYGTALSNAQLNAAVSGVSGGSAPGALTYDPAAGTIFNAGSHTLNVAAAATANYNAASFSVPLTVNKAALTIKADDKSKTYGGAAVGFTVSYNGFVNGDDANDLSGTLTYNFADSVSTAAGEYTITASGLTAANYSITFQNGRLTVNKANLTVKADDKSKTYGTANPALTGSLTGIQNSDNITAGYSTSAVTLSNAGTYSIVPNLVDPNNRLSNYNVTATSGTLTINKADQTIAWTTPAAITYGTALGAAQLNAAATGVAGGTAPGALTYNPASGAVLNAGTQTLTVTAAETANYNQAVKSVSLTVNKAPLTVKADDKAKIIGAAAVPFTVSYFGFVNGNTAANLGGALAFNFADSTATPAGSYTITPSGLTSSNYAITFQSGTLTVRYGVEALFDQNGLNMSGDTVQLKLKTVDAAGNNLSSQNLLVTAITARLLPNGTPFEVANEPRNPNGAPGDFTFTQINRAPGYLFRLKTDIRWAAGTYEVSYRIGNDPTTHTIQFRLGGNR